MQLSNRALLLFALFAAILAGTALWLEYGARPPVALAIDAPPPPLIPTVRREGGREVAPSGPLRVRLEGGRASSATLSCDGVFRSQRPFERGAVAFPTIPLGQCSVMLQGTDVPYEPVYPGDQLACRNQDGITACSGGLAVSYAARVSIGSETAGEVYVDGEDAGRLPVSDHPVRVGKRLVVARFDDGTTASWTLVVSPDETIHMHFPSRGTALPIDAALRRRQPSDTTEDAPSK